MIKAQTLVLLFLISLSQLFGQRPDGQPHPVFKGEKKKPAPEATKGPAERSAYNLIKSDAGCVKSPDELIDTLNFPLAGTYALYVYDGGFVSGNNAYDDKAKANIFEQGSPSLLKGVLIDFAVATSSTIDIEIAAWDDSGADGSPGNKIASTTIPIDDIFIDILNNQTTYIPFETPVLMTPTFFVGVVLPFGPDTVAIYTNTDGDTDPATAWEQWNSNQWFPYDDEDSWGYKMAHAIFPIVDADIGLLASFYADPLTLLPGESTTFFDASYGDPVSWQWSFEGGTPDNSNEQNPTVTYETEGSFTVTLIIGDGENISTLTREDYIQVTTEIPVPVDTLNYPLEGIYTLYKITPDGGYVCGTNLFNDKAKLNYFSIAESFSITGLLVDFVLASGGNPDIELVIWNNDGNGGRPGTKLATGMLELNTIKSDILNNMMSYVSFDNPVVLDHSFYAGFMLPEAEGDTLAVWSNEDGDTYPGIAWDLWEDGQWVPLADQSSWGMNLAMAIHPIVEYQTSILESRQPELVPVFPNPSSGEVTLDLSGFPGTREVTLQDMDGSVLTRIPVPAYAGSVILDLSGYPRGVYLLRVHGENASGIRKIIRH